MSSYPKLEGPSLDPASGGPAKQLIVLLHGYGADGNDLIGLAPHFARLLPDAAFVSPHAPFPCEMAPFGRQWFSLSDRAPARMMEGARMAAPILDRFLDLELEARKLTDAQLALVGFSQGTMTALHVALRRVSPCAGVLGYSGALLGAETLASEIRVRPPVMLIHGDDDPVVDYGLHQLSVSALDALDVPVEGHTRPGLGHSIDMEGLTLGGAFLRGLFAAA
ncbi:MAG TPA: alpha/beta fold hydrolase [Alphaproteobacteria bacterium]|nr:alpha/beta fold hydrolase [Alphaproteobacteria bacterium]